MRQCMGTGTQVHARPRALGVVWHPPTGGLCQGMRVQEGGGGGGEQPELPLLCDSVGPLGKDHPNCHPALP